MSDLISKQINYLTSLEKIMGHIAQYRKKICNITSNDRILFKSYLNSMGLVLTQIDNVNITHPDFLILVPTIIPEDTTRLKLLIENVKTYTKNPNNKVVLFFNSIFKDDVNEYIENFEPYKSQVAYIIYSHKKSVTHVGFARAAIAYYMLNLSPDQKIVVSDDRRILRSRTNKKIDNLTLREYDEVLLYLRNISEYIDENDNSIVSPLSMRAKASGKKVFMDPEQYPMSQIYFGKADTFIKIYICTNKNGTCQLTPQGYNLTVKLDSCFSRLFEDCSFINSGYDNGFNMKSYTAVMRVTQTTKSVARKNKDLKSLDPEDAAAVCSAMNNCIIHDKDDNYAIRWGNVYQNITSSVDNDAGDGYDYHRSMIKDCRPEETPEGEFVMEDLICKPTEDTVKIKWENSVMDKLQYQSTDKSLIESFEIKSGKYIVKWKPTIENISSLNLKGEWKKKLKNAIKC